MLCAPQCVCVSMCGEIGVLKELKEQVHMPFVLNFKFSVFCSEHYQFQLLGRISQQHIPTVSEL